MSFEINYGENIKKIIVEKAKNQIIYIPRTIEFLFKKHQKRMMSDLKIVEDKLSKQARNISKSYEPERKYSWILQDNTSNSTELVNKINDILNHCLEKYDLSAIFVEDELERSNALKAFLLANKDDKITENFPMFYEMFDLKEDENYSQLKESLGKKEQSSKKEDKKKKEEVIEKKSENVNELKNQIRKLSEENNDFKKKYNDVSKELQVLKEELENKKKNNEEIKESLGQREKEQKKEEELHYYSLNDISNSLYNATFIGFADTSSITKIGQKWSIKLRPREIMIDKKNLTDCCKLENININKIFKDFELKISDTEIREIENLGIKKEGYIDEWNVTNAFKEKELIFYPDLDENNVTTATLDRIIKAKPSSFQYVSIVPFIEESYANLTKKIEEGKEILIKNYSGCFHESIKYLVCNDGRIIQVDLINDRSNNNDPFIWKAASKFHKSICKLDKLTENIDYVLSIDDHDDFKLVTYFIKNEVFAKFNPQKANKNDLDKVEESFINAVLNKAKASYLFYDEKDIINFHIALKTSQLVILSGETGTGKTKLPKIYSSTLNMVEGKNVLFIPITPSYTEPSDILGYFKPITNSDKYDGLYSESSTGLVSFLYEASKQKDRLFMVIFDEMNLSQIEYWFSPFMSLLEEKVGERKLQLYSDNLKCSNEDKFPSSIEIGNNVVFIGTVNQDETTKEMSDRLSDRAIIINLRKSKFMDYYSSLIDDEKETPFDMDPATFFSFYKAKDDYIKYFNENEIKFLDDLNDRISSLNYQKGISYRTLEKISNYLQNSEDLLDRKEALDFIIKQTVLTKINGSANEIRNILEEQGIKEILLKYEELSDFKNTLKEIERKLENINNYGYTR